MARQSSEYAVAFDGVDGVQQALRDAQRQLRGTDKSSEVYKVGIRAVKQTALPALRMAGLSSDATPQMRITGRNWKAKRSKFPRAELENKAGRFTSKRSRRDVPTYGAIYWGSINGGRKFGRSGPWIERTTSQIAPAVQRSYQRGLVKLLKDAGLL
jgi:hypothetical protein